MSLKWVNWCADSVTLRRACCRSCKQIKLRHSILPSLKLFHLPTAQIRGTWGKLTPICGPTVTIRGRGQRSRGLVARSKCCYISIRGQGDGSYTPWRETREWLLSLDFIHPGWHTNTATHSTGSCWWQSFLLLQKVQSSSGNILPLDYKKATLSLNIIRVEKSLKTLMKNTLKLWSWLCGSHVFIAVVADSWVP